MQTYGTLVLSLPDGEEQTFELAKEQIAIGRGPVNDIVLRDGKISRSHVRMECTEAGVTLEDLGSANGTLVNGVRTQRSSLAPGDVISLGNMVLRFEAPLEDDLPDVTLIQDMADLEHTFAQDTLSMTINDTSRSRLVVHLPDKTWELPLIMNRTIIGRAGESDIPIEHPKVSRRHAEIERRDDGNFVIRDLGSTNGTLFAGQPVQEHLLQDGDVVQVGPARLVYKAPFTLEDLTIFEPPSMAQPRARVPVVFVPGLMGSELWQGNDRIWPNMRYLFTQPESFVYNEGNKMEARGIVNEVVIVPNLIKSEQYNRLGDFLVESLGYQRGVDLLEFPYDWRQDVRISARQLAQTIEAWNVGGPIVIMAHSLGTLVTRYYVECLGGRRWVERVIFMGGPHYGVPKSIANLIHKVDLLPFGLLGDRLRDVLATFPSLYQILPVYESAFDQNGVPINVFEDETWLPEDKRPFLRMAREFRQEVGTRLCVPSVSIFGYGIKTVDRINVERAASGEWTKLDLVVNPNGDSAIPENSTVLEGSDIHPVQQYHGSLFVDNDVRMRLKLELTGLRRGN